MGEGNVARRAFMPNGLGTLGVPHTMGHRGNIILSANGAAPA